MAKPTRERYSTNVDSELKRMFLEISDTYNINRSDLTDEAFLLLINKYSTDADETVIIDNRVNKTIKKIIDTLELINAIYITNKRFNIGAIISDLIVTRNNLKSLIASVNYNQSVNLAFAHTQTIVESLASKLDSSSPQDRKDVFIESGYTMQEVKLIWNVVDTIDKARSHINKLVTGDISNFKYGTTLTKFESYITVLLDVIKLPTSLTFITQLGSMLALDLQSIVEDQIDYDMLGDIEETLHLFTPHRNEKEIVNQYQSLFSQLETKPVKIRPTVVDIDEDDLPIQLKSEHSELDEVKSNIDGINKTLDIITKQLNELMDK